MRQAILTKYIGPTNHRGSRVKAIADAGSITVAWDHALDPEENHATAACALALKLAWSQDHRNFHRNWLGGVTPAGYAWVFDDREWRACATCGALTGPGKRLCPKHSGGGE